MGRRKERRIAAVAASRRVKLDLFAEPSEDLGSSSKQDEVGGADDAKNRAGLPSSPTSSGKEPENPLVLLGQYSDDEEVDDGSSREQNRAIAEDAHGVSDDSEEKEAAGQGSEVCIIEERNGDSAEKAEQIQTEDGSLLLDATEKLETGGDAGAIATSADVLDENCLTRKTPAASTSDTQVGDVTSGWKLVWHEESNQYYYWNIATGETSWEVPDILIPAVGSDMGNNGEKEKANVASNATNPNSEMTEVSDHKEIGTLAGDILDDIKADPDADQNHPEICSSAVPQNFVTSPGESNDIHRDEKAKFFNSQKLENGESCETGNLSSHVIKHCELLLEKLNSVKRYKGHLHEHDQMCKNTFEVEIRLADMKSLACHGSLLLPFWQFSEKRLQQLEESINVSLLELKAEEANKGSSSGLFPESSCEVDVNSCGKKAVSASDDSFAPEPTGRAELQNNLETYSHQTTGDENVPSEKYMTGYSGNASGVAEEDMDVDMEVEDAAPSSNLCISVSSGQPRLPTLPSADPGNSGLEEVYGVPPAPAEDWIPPPPPDDEPFPPPPPPDEPPEDSYSQPSDLVSVTSFPYVEQYNMYPSSEFPYVAQTSANVAFGNLYGQTEGCQPTVSQPPLYFEALPDAYGTATLAVNPIEAGLYYGLQNATPQSLVQADISDSLGSLDTGDLGSASLPKGEVGVSVMGGNSLKATSKPLSPQTSFQSSAATTVNESVSVSSVSTSTGAVCTSTIPSKAQSKVPRSKKRTVSMVSSLRSNKKVFSMVDKWKAAKEELQEQEEEPENALEILERKRQREIEEWHKQQIASGEARENANFQPLGGDWRERVKRKRAQLERESVESPSDVVSKAISQPDLDELSKGLPNGWQAFLDDSSKQVYYGNTSTSETSWIRPTPTH